jgi:hypothetical protein
MRADHLVRIEGKCLIGHWIKTPPRGVYPGGLAKVVQIKPDKNAPDICMVVDLPGFGEIGVFGYEQVQVNARVRLEWCLDDET